MSPVIRLYFAIIAYSYAVVTRAATVRTLLYTMHMFHRCSGICVHKENTRLYGR